MLNQAVTETDIALNVPVINLSEVRWLLSAKKITYLGEEAHVSTQIETLGLKSGGCLNIEQALTSKARAEQQARQHDKNHQYCIETFRHG